MHFSKTEKNSITRSVPRFFSLLAAFYFLIEFGCTQHPNLPSKSSSTITNSPKRIITLAPSLGELVSDLLKDDSKIVGVSEYTDFPKNLISVPSVGPFYHINIEKVMGLKPDIVFATSDGNSKEQILHLREMKIRVEVVDTRSLKEIGQSILVVAQALGVYESGKIMVNRLETGLEHLRHLPPNAVTHSIMLQIGDHPLVVAGKGSFLNSAIEWLGVNNVFRDSGRPYPHPSIEDVLRRDPEQIIILAMDAKKNLYEQMAHGWNEFPQLRAVKNHKIIILESDTLLRPTIRILDGLSKLKQAIYGKK